MRGANSFDAGGSGGDNADFAPAHLDAATGDPTSAVRTIARVAR
jgi:hypothetical protein